jgi:hypothetical protein
MSNKIDEEKRVLINENENLCYKNQELRFEFESAKRELDRYSFLKSGAPASGVDGEMQNLFNKVEELEDIITELRE